MKTCLGLKCYAVEEVKDQKVKTAFFMVGQTKSNFLNQQIRKGPLVNLLKKKGLVFITWLLLSTMLTSRFQNLKTRAYVLLIKKEEKAQKD
jgi:hypothetical protein